MNPNAEIRHLLDLMPASGRMYTKLISAPNNGQIIKANSPRFQSGLRPIQINFDLWEQLPRNQRDLLLLRTVAWLTAPRWNRWSLSQIAAVGGLGVGLIGIAQGNVAEVVTAGGVVAWAGWQTWRKRYSPDADLEADETAIEVAQWRGYSTADAAQALMEAIEAVAQMEGRSLDVTEVLRRQSLRKMSQNPSVMEKL